MHIPRSICHKVKANLHFMSLYMNHIKSGIKSNLNFSQFITLRFRTDLVYNSYLLYNVIGISQLISACNKAYKDYFTIISKVQKLSREVPIRRFVSDMNRLLHDEGPQILPHLMFETGTDATINTSISDRIYLTT